MSAVAQLSRRQRKLIRTWARRRRLIKCREVSELTQLGLIGYWGGPIEGGGYASYPCLTDAGLQAVGNVRIRCMVHPSLIEEVERRNAANHPSKGAEHETPQV